MKPAGDTRKRPCWTRAGPPRRASSCWSAQTCSAELARLRRRRVRAAAGSPTAGSRAAAPPKLQSEPGVPRGVDHEARQQGDGEEARTLRIEDDEAPEVDH